MLSHSCLDINSIILKDDEIHKSLISPKHHSIYFGLSLYETILISNKKAIFLDNHFDRLEKGILYLGWYLPSNFRENIIQRIYYLLEQLDTNVQFYRLRIMVSKKNNDVSILDTILLIEPFFIENNNSYSLYGIFPNKSISPTIPPFLKITGNYENLIANNYAKDLGYDEAIMIDVNNRVCEATFANLFFISENKIYTPMNYRNFLNGITKDIVMKICKNNNISCIEQDILTSQLDLFKEGAFLTSSLRGIQAIHKITIKKSETDIQSYSFDSSNMILKLKKLYKIEQDIG